MIFYNWDWDSWRIKTNIISSWWFEVFFGVKFKSAR